MRKEFAMRLLAWLSIVLDLGVFAIVPMLSWILNTNNDSFEAFQTFRDVLVPTRNIYFGLTLLVNFTMVVMVSKKAFAKINERKRLGTVEWIALCVFFVVILLGAFVYFTVPTGPFF